MIVAGIYSFNGGLDYINANHPNAMDEMVEIVTSVDSEKCLTKHSKEKTKKNILYSPIDLNNEFMSQFKSRGWKEKERLACDYRTTHYVDGYVPSSSKRCFKGFRELDYLKSKVGVEVQFGKYSFMVYDILSKMPMLRKNGIIDCGIEIVPVKDFAKKMSTGVSCYEQILCDLNEVENQEQFVPVVIVGIAANQ